jgi:hypothetical protein
VASKEEKIRHPPCNLLIRSACHYSLFVSHAVGLFVNESVYVKPFYFDTTLFLFFATVDTGRLTQTRRSSGFKRARVRGTLVSGFQASQLKLSGVATCWKYGTRVDDDQRSPHHRCVSVLSMCPARRLLLVETTIVNLAVMKALRLRRPNSSSREHRTFFSMGANYVIFAAFWCYSLCSYFLKWESSSPYTALRVERCCCAATYT